jgi:hypothetical protein
MMLLEKKVPKIEETKKERKQGKGKRLEIKKNK